MRIVAFITEPQQIDRILDHLRRNQRGDFEFGRDMRAIFQTPADNIFLLKVSFWLNP